MTYFLSWLFYNHDMKVKIIEKDHELDLEDEINDFIDDKQPIILSMHYQVAMTFSSELEYSFSCLIVYEDKWFSFILFLYNNIILVKTIKGGDLMARGVNCQVDSCVYNENCNCTAKEIVVCNCHCNEAKEVQETACKTFKCR